jgi:hypothetical protein
MLRNDYGRERISTDLALPECFQNCCR